MIQKASVTLVVLALCASSGALAQTPAEIFAEMDRLKRASIEGVSNMKKMSTTMGFCTLEYFDQETTTASDGRGEVNYMRLVPLGEVMERKNADSPMANASADELNSIAGQLRSIGPGLDAAVLAEVETVGIPADLTRMLTTNRPEDQPWLSPMPSDMLSNYAVMLDAAAEGKRQNARQDLEAEQEARTDPLAAAAANTRLIGRETIGGRPAFHLLADNLNNTQITDRGGVNEQEFTIHSMHLFVDADHYVPLKMQIDGEVLEGGERRAMRIEREDTAYEAVPGCGSMYEPQRTAMRIAGILSEEQKEQMAEAQIQMEQFEAQMASLPYEQQQMIMRQMGPQMEMLRGLTSGQGIEVVTLVTGMQCNAGLPTDSEYMQTAPGMSAGACIGFGNPRFEAGDGPSSAGAAGAGDSSGSSNFGSGSGNSGASGAGGAGGAGGANSGSNSSSDDSDPELVSIIQRHFETLGYDPGSTDGTMTKQTARAIVKFEAANGMPVTGKPTPQLAGILAAAADAMK